ncbi:hypothetical protein RhiirA1_480343 [Rhizophagus irregularis]|uniref:DUF1871 domain-containing protein n=1 Tax=Rhizophagus irregularis TaxID=588596 RepID=A0A2N0QPH5_9GLOM|nr:hypothetical protein RhiirA1_480343 [Rhizophagus irregularis]
MMMNQKAIQLLQQWDPFNIGEDKYDTETADVVAALQGIDDPSNLAKVIQPSAKFEAGTSNTFESFKIVCIEGTSSPFSYIDNFSIPI